MAADRIDPEFLEYHHEDHASDDDPLKRMGYATAQRPIFTTTINITLAIRLALRRYLGIEPLAGPCSRAEASTRAVHRGRFGASPRQQGSKTQ